MDIGMIAIGATIVSAIGVLWSIFFGQQTLSGILKGKGKIVTRSLLTLIFLCSGLLDVYAWNVLHATPVQNSSNIRSQISLADPSMAAASLVLTGPNSSWTQQTDVHSEAGVGRCYDERGEKQVISSTIYFPLICNEIRSFAGSFAYSVEMTASQWDTGGMIFGYMRYCSTTCFILYHYFWISKNGYMGLDFVKVHIANNGSAPDDCKGDDSCVSHLIPPTRTDSIESTNKLFVQVEQNPQQGESLITLYLNEHLVSHCFVHSTFAGQVGVASQMVNENQGGSGLNSNITFHDALVWQFS